MARSEQREFVPALGYHWLTHWYDLTIRFTMPEKKFRRRLIELVDPVPTERLLEFGYDTGRNMLVLWKRCPGADITGLDIDPNVRAIAKGALQREGVVAKLDLYDGTTFPYPDAAFDAVFSSLVSHQLMPAQKHHAFREIRRVLNRVDDLWWAIGANLPIAECASRSMSCNCSMDSRIPART